MTRTRTRATAAQPLNRAARQEGFHVKHLLITAAAIALLSMPASAQFVGSQGQTIWNKAGATCLVDNCSETARWNDREASFGRPETPDNGEDDDHNDDQDDDQDNGDTGNGDDPGNGDDNGDDPGNGDNGGDPDNGDDHPDDGRDDDQDDDDEDDDSDD